MCTSGYGRCLEGLMCLDQVPVPRSVGPMTWYTERVEANPIITKAFTSFFGFILGDLLAQKVTGEEFSALR